MFTPVQFHQMFADYYAGIGWVPQLAYVLGALSLAGFAIPRLRMHRLALGLLGLLWLWTGGAYFYMVLGGHVPPLRIIGFLFLVQGGMLAGLAALEEYEPRMVTAAQRLLGWTLMLVAVFLYPLAGAAAGHVLPAAPAFGITPCPLVLFTFALLLLSPVRLPVFVYWVPTLWAVIGTGAAFLFGATQDLLLPVVALASLLGSGVLHLPAQPAPPRAAAPTQLARMQ